MELQPVTQSELEAVEGGMINLNRQHAPPQDGAQGGGSPTPNYGGTLFSFQNILIHQ